MAYDTVWPLLHELAGFERSGERRKTGPERAARARDDDSSADREQRAGTFEPPARGIWPTGPGDAEDENPRHQAELQRDPAAAPCPELRNLNQG